MSTQGASTAPVYSNGVPACNAFTWMDGRSQAESDELERLLGGNLVYRHTGWRMTPTLDAAKILHMKRTLQINKPVRYLSTSGYFNLFLTDRAVSDPSNACSRQLYNINTNQYDVEVLSAVGISYDELPKIRPTGERIGSITKQASQATGLSVGTPVYNGAHDQYCATIGAGMLNAGEVLLSAGTTWVIMGLSDHPLFSETYIAPGIHPINGLYGNIASLIGSGASMQWFKERFIDEDFLTINAEAAQRAGKTRELFYYPYPVGATYPLWNLQVRAAFTGIALEHDKYDFARAIMEGVSFNVRRALADFTNNGFSAKHLRIMGGASKSRLWCDLLAACTGMELSVCCEPDACAVGAAIIAAVGSGEYGSYREAVSHMSSPALTIKPDHLLAEELNRKFLEYDRMLEYILKYY